MNKSQVPPPLSGNETLYVATTSYTCGVIVEDDTVIFAAPILSWSVGKPLSLLHQWIKRRRGGGLQALDLLGRKIESPFNIRK